MSTSEHTAQSASEDRFVSAADNKGWLMVRLDGEQDNVALIEYLRVRLVKREGGRDYFSVKEGAHEGRSGSVVAKSATTSWLSEQLPPYRSPARLRFGKTEKKLSTPIGDIGAISSLNPIRTGTHPIQIPDFPHELGRPYLDETSAALNWFFLGTGNAKPGTNANYLHVGAVSEGCTTVTDFRKWTELYSYLVLCREGARNVGTLEVRD